MVYKASFFQTLSSVMDKKYFQKSIKSSRPKTKKQQHQNKTTKKVWKHTQQFRHSIFHLLCFQKKKSTLNSSDEGLTQGQNGHESWSVWYQKIVFSSLCDSILFVVDSFNRANHRVVAVQVVGKGTVRILKPMAFLSHKN